MSTQPDENLIDEPEAAPPLEYRSLCMLAVFGMIAAVFSILAVFHWLFLCFPLAAIWFGYRAVKQIRSAPTEYAGLGLARSGMVTAIILGLIGLIAQHYIKKYSIPSGYKPIAWELLQPNPSKPAEIIPETAYDLEPSDKDRDRRVYIKGYINLNMTNRTINLKQFILVPTASHCNFCQTQIKSTEMILVKLVGGLSLNATQIEIKIGGKLTIDRDQAANPFGGLPYQLEADWLQE